jgi:hypothetical protein
MLMKGCRYMRDGRFEERRGKKASVPRARSLNDANNTTHVIARNNSELGCLALYSRV